jgi:hypothetical protein
VRQTRTTFHFTIHQNSVILSEVSCSLTARDAVEGPASRLAPPRPLNLFSQETLKRIDPATSTRENPPQHFKSMIRKLRF